MNTVRFYITENTPDVRCPKCNAGLDIDEWNTEYGDVIEGDVLCECPVCDKSFKLITTVKISYQTKR